MEWVGIRAAPAAPRVEHAQVRLGEEEPATAEYDEILAGKGPAGTVLGDGTIERGIADVERCDLEGAELTVELRANVDGLDRAFFSPMRRLKKAFPSPEKFYSLIPCRKNSRFSGKRRGNRVRFTCRSSTSVSAKSVLMVRFARRLGVML